MADVNNVLSQISKSIREVSSSTGQFKVAANDNNRNVTKIIKDISNMFNSQRRDMSGLGSTLDEVVHHSQQASSKMDSVASAIGESIQVQTSMLGEMRNMTAQLRMVNINLNQIASNGGGLLGNNPLANATSALNGAGGGRNSLLNGALRMFGFGVAGSALAEGMDPGNLQGGPLAIATPFSGPNKPILDTIKARESNGDYAAQNPTSSASGAYQFTNGTWAERTQKYGIGTEYKRAADAPPEVQDAVADKYVSEILARPDVKGDVSRVPVIWFTGNNSGQMTPEQQAANPTMSLQQYQANWMQDFAKNNAGNNSTAPYNPSGQMEGAEGGSGNQSGPQSAPMGNADSSILQKHNLKDASHIQGLNPNFASSMSNFLAAAEQAGHKIDIYSGYRSPERQAQLFNAAVEKYGSPEAARKWVAPPGGSRHNHGTAADLQFSSEEAKNWAHQNAGKFGLNFRMGHEPWHIESGDASSVASNFGQYGNMGGGQQGPMQHQQQMFGAMMNGGMDPMSMLMPSMMGGNMGGMDILGGGLFGGILGMLNQMMSGGRQEYEEDPMASLVPQETAVPLPPEPPAKLSSTPETTPVPPQPNANVSEIGRSAMEKQAIEMAASERAMEDKAAIPREDRDTYSREPSTLADNSYYNNPNDTSVLTWSDKLGLTGFGEVRGVKLNSTGVGFA